MSKMFLAVLAVLSLAGLAPVEGNSSLRGIVEEQQPDQCCSKEEPVCVCGGCLDRDTAAVIRCVPPPNWDGDCCPDNDPPPPPDVCCSSEEPRCMCGNCASQELFETAQCKPAPGWDGDCCPDNDPPPVAECCSEKEPICGCGTCTDDPTVPSRCFPPLGWDGDCCPDEPPVEIAECCTADAPTCACGTCNADPESPKFCRPAAGWDGDCCPDEPEPEACEQKPFVAGTCKAAIPRWSLNPDTGNCEEFSYGGCDANANNFESEKECVTTCNPTGPTPEPDECCPEETPDCCGGICLAAGSTNGCGINGQLDCSSYCEPVEEVAECCTEDEPFCLCGSPTSPGYCGDANTAARVQCPQAEGGTCCPIEEPEPEVDECCTEDAPACVCATLDSPGRCVTEETALMIKCPTVLGATCCKPPPPVDPPVDQCCSEDAPVCACGSRCVTAEQAATLRCAQTDPEDTCCDSDNLADKQDKKEKKKGKKAKKHKKNKMMRRKRNKNKKAGNKKSKL